MASVALIESSWAMLLTRWKNAVPLLSTTFRFPRRRFISPEASLADKEGTANCRRKKNFPIIIMLRSTDRSATYFVPEKIAASGNANWTFARHDTKGAPSRKLLLFELFLSLRTSIFISSSLVRAKIELDAREKLAGRPSQWKTGRENVARRNHYKFETQIHLD